ncbi:MAG: RecQ family ATP-dependent DNA helicase [Bacteroides sp.]|nr:RecQ family ATP-dependent DNA helicase [Bacteroides sp.]
MKEKDVVSTDDFGIADNRSSASIHQPSPTNSQLSTINYQLPTPNYQLSTINSQLYHSILKEYWGYDNFRGIQEEIICSIGAGKDTLGLMPTGGGKSITFQVPALTKEGMCLVVTPLIALMKDQIAHLRERGIRALAIHSGMSRQEIVTTLENAIFGNYKFLYIAPERLGTDIFRTKLRKMHISMITVDESHCISQWGYDFRPAYLQIAELRELLPDIPILALTATATPAVVQDIQEKLHFRTPNVFRMSFKRENLTYIVRKTEDKLKELQHILHSVVGSAIVYTRSRANTREVCELLQKSDFTGEYYHAGLNNAEKDLRQLRWQNGTSRVMVATNAFGMGIDKPDVRLVIHWDMPDSLEAYFQEAGRAGRDGQRAYAVILNDGSEAVSLRRRISDTFPEKAYVREVYEQVQYYYQMAMGDGLGCRRDFDIEDFCRKFRRYPVQVHSALKLLTLAGYLEYIDDQESASSLHFIASREDLYRLQGLGTEAETLINVVLRQYTGLFTSYAIINEQLLATLTGLNRQQVYQQLIRLSKLQVVKYIPRKQTPYIIYTRERQPADTLQLPAAIYEERRERMSNRIEATIRYLTNDEACRSTQLLEYFGEESPERCKRCDTCIAQKKASST